MIRRCSCPDCVAASVRNIDALVVFTIRLSAAAAEARRLLDQGEAIAARDVIDAAAIKAGDLAQDMIAYAHLIDQHAPEAAPIAAPMGRLH